MTVRAEVLSLLKRSPKPKPRSLRAFGVFAGVGGIERGLEQAGHSTVSLCEIDPGASAILARRFPKVVVHKDIRRLDSVPDSADLLTAGFPCQDLSQAGRTAGLSGARSGLIKAVFRRIEDRRVPWLLLENVPFMLRLKNGNALRYILRSLTRNGYAWAYRVVDSQSFGLPQRRDRVFLVATTVGDPRDVLLADDVGRLPACRLAPADLACGFYWTEGNRGLGWAVDAIPPLKGGTRGHGPTPPAVLLPSGRIIIPDIRDAERLQGLPINWTRNGDLIRANHRWRLVGNAVTVPVAKWIGERLLAPGTYDASTDKALGSGDKLPQAAWSMDGRIFVSDVSKWPVHRRRRRLRDFLLYEGRPLSVRATAGFLSRIRKSNLRLPPKFEDRVARHLRRVQAAG